MTLLVDAAHKAPLRVPAASLIICAALLSAKESMVIAQELTITTAARPRATDEVKPLEEIVVTARKRSERLSDVPESITALSSTDLVRKGIETLEDVGYQTPNLQLNRRQDNTTNVVIRGVGAFGAVLGVGFNIDDVPNFTDQSMRLIDVDRVEILKGPQGTLYGDNAIGGLVRYVYKMPTFDWNGEASTEVGSYGQINLFAAQNFTVIADKLALRVSAYDSKGDGYLTNSALFGIDANPSTDYGIRTSLLYKPSDDLSAQLILRYAYLRDGRDPYSLLGSVTSYTYDVQLFQPTWQERPTYGAILKVNDDLGPFQFTSISSFTQETIDFDFDVTLTPPGVPGLRLYTIRGNPPTQPITQEFRLTSPSGGTIDWLVGLYGDTIRNILAYPNKYDQVGVFPDTPPIVASDSDTRQSDIAVFGTLNYHLGSLTAGVGLRLNETKFKANVYVSPGATPNQANSITSRAALPKFSLSYFLPNGELLYADVAKGEQPGGVNTQSAIATAYEAETATSYEIGTKGQAMDRRFAYEAAAFYVRNANHQYQSNVFINGVLFQAITNIGLSRSYGTEANISWRPTPEISLHVGGGLLNAKWIRADYFGAAVDGKIIPNSPSATANIGAAYSRSVFNGLRADANVDMNYTGSLYWDIPNTAGSASPHYWLGDARIALGTNNGAWQVAFRVSNILGAKYWTEYYANFFPPPTPNIGAIGAPRQVMASVSVKW